MPMCYEKGVAVSDGKSRAGRRAARRLGFSLIEMLVTIVIITLLIAVGLAVGREIQQSSRRQLTRTELKNLAAALSEVQRRCGRTPAMLNDFLATYQRLHAYKDSGGVWRMRPNLLTQWPAGQSVVGPIAMPGGTSMPAITQVNDAFGNPIVYVAAVAQYPRAPYAPCFVSAGPDGFLNTPDDQHSYDP